MSGYLEVLTNLVMESGYTLDYVYQRDELGGRPILYARAVKAEPFMSYAALTNSIRGVSWDRRCWESWGSRFYGDKLHPDGSKAGYFQFVVLDLMGDQLFHFWHDGYHDETIVCNQRAFNRTDAIVTIREGARRHDLRPRVEVGTDHARVTVFVSTEWGGLYRMSFKVGRKPPHTVSVVTKEQLVEYHPNYVM